LYSEVKKPRIFVADNRRQSATVGDSKELAICRKLNSEVKNPGIFVADSLDSIGDTSELGLRNKNRVLKSM
uniref:Uncharacterized protein n=1 Tax=Romanomermis culicivorax TaxID=13658 RepID=A0A915KDL9_ROMCU